MSRGLRLGLALAALLALLAAAAPAPAQSLYVARFECVYVNGSAGGSSVYANVCNNAGHDTNGTVENRACIAVYNPFNYGCGAFASGLTVDPALQTATVNVTVPSQTSSGTLAAMFALSASADPSLTHGYSHYAGLLPEQTLCAYASLNGQRDASVTLGGTITASSGGGGVIDAALADALIYAGLVTTLLVNEGCQE